MEIKLILEIAAFLIPLILGALGFYVKSKISQAVDNFEDRIMDNVDQSSKALEKCIQTEIELKLKPILDKQKELTDDHKHFFSTLSTHHTDIEVLKTNSEAQLKSIDRLIDKIDKLLEMKTK